MKKNLTLWVLAILAINIVGRAEKSRNDSFNARVEAGEEPEASSWGFMFSVTTAVDHYTEWSSMWKKSTRSISTNDRTINHLMSGYMLGIAKYLSRNSDPILLEFYLTFVGTHVPEEFDDIWTVVLVELPDVERETARLVDAALKKDGYTPLLKRVENNK